LNIDDGLLAEAGRLSAIKGKTALVRADHDEVLVFIRTHRLTGSGIGWMDAHLLSWAVLSNAPLWTLDKRLRQVARALDIQAAL